MVVECKKCGTRFQLDSARIPDDGIRVRCSRCKNAFHLQHPSKSQENAVEAVVAGTLADNGLAVPSSTHDHPAAGQSNAGAASVGAAAAVEGVEGVEDDGFDGSEDEDDWEFNEELPEFDDDDESDEPEDEMGGEPEPDLDGELDTDAIMATDYNQDSHDVGSIDLDHDRSFTTDPEASYANALSGVDEPDAPVIDTDSMEMSAVDLVSSNMASEPAPVSTPVETVQTPKSEPSIEGAHEEAFGSADDFSNLMEPDDLPPVAATVASQDEASEIPEDWDFFGDNDGPTPAAAPIAGVRMKTVKLEASTDASRKTSADEQIPAGWKGLEGDRPVSGIAGVATALAWVAFFGLFAAGVYFGVMESVDRSVSAPAFVDLGEMRAANIRGQFLETTRAGTLYVVTGDLVNPGNDARALHHTVYVNLLGANGLALDAPPAFAGRDVELNQLREMTVAELHENQQAASRTLSGQEIGPGQSARFAAVFVSMPEEASHFQIRAVESEAAAELAPDVVAIVPTDTQ